MVEVENVGKFVFLMMLLWAGWQDFRTRSVSQSGLVVFGGLGIVFSLLNQRPMVQVLLSCALGLALLGIGKITDGAIGDGDGWFFIISGFYLSVSKNILLFLSGLGCCFCIGLVWIVYGHICGKEKKKSLPFLSILIPAGVLVLMS